MLIAALDAARASAEAPAAEDASAEAPATSAARGAGRRVDGHRRRVPRGRGRLTDRRRSLPGRRPRGPRHATRRRRGRAGPGELDDGAPLAGATARRLACDAARRHDPRARRPPAQRRPEDTIDPTRAAPRTGRPRPRLPLPRLHRPPLRRRPSHRALGARRRDEPAQPRAAVPAPPPAAPRGRLHGGAQARWAPDVLPRRRTADRGLSGRRHPAASRRCTPGGSGRTRACRSRTGSVWTSTSASTGCSPSHHPKPRRRWHRESEAALTRVGPAAVGAGVGQRPRVAVVA